MSVKPTTLFLVLPPLALSFAYAAPVMAKPGLKLPMAAASFEEIDTDNSGAISTAELEAFQAARFSQIDADEDGSVSKEELKAQISSALIASGREVDEERLDQHVERIFERADQDESGGISNEELPQRRMSRFISRADTDENGEISNEEWTAAKEKHEKRHENRGHKKKGGKKKGGDKRPRQSE